MRLLLLVAALLGMLPQHAAMSHGGDHCMAPGPAASHAGAPMGQGHDGHDEDCPHCPPAQCAIQAHCAQFGTPHVMVGRMATTFAPDARTGAREAATHWSSRSHAPPVPPPLTSLT
ncbi:MAG TPA: hypothetical protein PLI93_01065 [Gemmatimonadales bacterium]|nr:hypothetical protein [Gemmatimonadales bacterium]